VRRSKSSSKSVRKCLKGIGQAGSRICRCGKKGCCQGALTRTEMVGAHPRRARGGVPKNVSRMAGIFEIRQGGGAPSPILWRSATVGTPFGSSVLTT
jgi:hypothetical protein